MSLLKPLNDQPIPKLEKKMKIRKFLKLTAACVAVFALSGCGPDIEKAAIPEVERIFRQKGIPAKCAEITNIRKVNGEAFVYTGKALIKQGGQKSCYTVLLEEAGENVLVKIDASSRYDLN